MPVNGGPQKEIYEVISTELKKHLPDIDCRIVSVGRLTASYMHKIIENIVASNIDLIVVFNVHTALIIQKQLEKDRRSIPVLFTGLTAPDKYGLIENFEVPGKGFSGAIYTSQNMEPFCEFFYECLPSIHSILVPTQMTGKHFLHKQSSRNLHVGTMEDLPTQIKTFFENKNVRCNITYNSDAQELLKEVACSMKTYDAVISIEGSRILTWSCDINRYCIEHGALFYTGWTTSVKRGEAALGYGVDYQTISYELARQAIQILVNKISISEIPTKVFSFAREACINTSLLKRYEIDLERVLKVADKWKANIYK